MSQKLFAHCHCRAVTFSVELSQGVESIRRCNCSLCRMRGAVAVSAVLSGIEVLSGQDSLTEYRFNTRQAAHYFCRQCGIYTFHQRRSNPNEYGVNVACIEGMSPFDFIKINVMDGVHHPAEGGGGVIGVLTYQPVQG